MYWVFSWKMRSMHLFKIYFILQGGRLVIVYGRVRCRVSSSYTDFVDYTNVTNCSRITTVLGSSLQ